MGLNRHKISRVVWGCFLLVALAAAGFGQERQFHPKFFDLFQYLLRPGERFKGGDDHEHNQWERHHQQR